jgi:ATP-dependent Lon protease
MAGPTGFFDDAHVHIHVPEGATPKDGPSAGITIALALLSLARGQSVRKVAMTGELTLSGLVLPVGGIREKVIAARRGDITELILPERNRRDFDELPDYLRAGLNVHFASRFHQVPAYALGTEALPGA